MSKFAQVFGPTVATFVGTAGGDEELEVIVLAEDHPTARHSFEDVGPDARVCFVVIDNHLGD